MQWLVSRKRFCSHFSMLMTLVQVEDEGFVDLCGINLNSGEVTLHAHAYLAERVGLTAFLSFPKTPRLGDDRNRCTHLHPRLISLSHAYLVMIDNSARNQNQTSPIDPQVKKKSTACSINQRSNGTVENDAPSNTP